MAHNMAKSVMKRAMSTVAQSPPKLKHLEVERKFLLNARLTDHLKSNDSKRHEFAAGLPGGSIELPKFSRLFDNRIRDTYFDLNEQLSKAGMWLRRRRVGSDLWDLEPSESPCLESEASEDCVQMWELKIRRGGTFVASECEEVVGLYDVRKKFKELLPSVDPRKLREEIDLVTDRQTWEVKSVELFRVVMERAQGCSVDRFGQDCIFVHDIGEVEVTAEVSDSEFERERERLRTQLNVFMERYKMLFPTPPGLMGKLSAYYKWKEEMGPSKFDWK